MVIGWRRHPGSLLFIVLAAAVCVPSWGCRGRTSRPLEFTITFGVSNGLRPGQPVVYHGVTIGEVRRVELTKSGCVAVNVRIRREQRGRVFRESEYLIEKQGSILDATDKRQLVVKDRPGASHTPVLQGDIVQGTDGWLDQASHRLEDAARAAKVGADRLWDHIQQWSDSPEGQRLRESLRQFGEAAKEESAEQFNRFRREQLPKLRQQVLEVERRLRKEGRSKDAESLQRSFDEFADRLEGDNRKRDQSERPSP